MGEVNRRFQSQIVPYLEGTLPARARRRFEERLRQSDACRCEVETFKRLTGLMSQVPVQWPSERDRDRFVPRVHERIEREYAFRARRAADAQTWRRQALVGTACATLLFGAGISIGRFHESRSVRPNRTSVAASRTTATSENADAIRVVAEMVPDKLADRLVRLDPDRVVPRGPMSLTPVTYSLSGSSESDTERLEPGAGEMVASASASGNAASFNWTRLIAMISLPPSEMYGEAASYLVANR